MSRGSDASDFNRHEMDNLGHSGSSDRNTWSNADCARQQNGPCIKALVSLLALITLTLVVAGCWFVGYFARDGNVNSAVWAFFTGAVACGITSLFVLHLCQKLTSWHDRKTLQGIKFFGMIMSAVSIIATISYVIAGAVATQKDSLKGEDLFVTALFSGLCLGCSFLLYLTAQWYQNNLPLHVELQTTPPSDILDPQPGPSHIV